MNTFRGSFGIDVRRVADNGTTLPPRRLLIHGLVQDGLPPYSDIYRLAPGQLCISLVAALFVDRLAFSCMENPLHASAAAAAAANRISYDD